jgi:hypothetical protein
MYMKGVGVGGGGWGAFSNKYGPVLGCSNEHFNYLGRLSEWCSGTCKINARTLTSAPVTSEVGLIPGQTHSSCDREGDSLGHWQRRFPPGLQFPPTYITNPPILSIELIMSYWHSALNSTNSTSSQKNYPWFCCKFQIMFISSIWIFCSGILTSFAPNYAWVLFLRSQVGVGIVGGNFA